MAHDQIPPSGNAAGRERELIEHARRSVRDDGESTARGPSFNQFLTAVLKSRLLDRTTLQQLAKDFPSPDGGRKPSARKFARFLIERGDLTAYQVERLLAGRTEGFFLGDCKILGVLGAGGMGKVYLAEQMRLGRQVAVKVLPPHRADDADARARFRREARAAAELKHPNIVQIHDVAEADGTLFIIMELVRGPSLSERVKQHGPLSVAESTDVVRQVAAGLQHAWERGIVHRDIKPSNLVLEGGTVKILDLGLARRLDRDGSITQDGAGLGTPDYMSPEQFVDARHADIRSDLYSLGCTWYHLLTGSAPFAGGSAIEKCHNHVHTPPPSVQSVTPTVPDGVAAAITRLMAKKPEDRYQTPAELLEDLREWTDATYVPNPTLTWTESADTANPDGLTESPEQAPTPLVPAPAGESDPATLITAPSTSVPSFLLYLIPIMAALVLGGAYFGIRALLDRQADAEPLIVTIPAEPSTSRPSDLPVDRGDAGPVEAQPAADGDPQVEPLVSKPADVEVTPQPAATETTVVASSDEAPAAVPILPPPPPRPVTTWQFHTADDWLATWNDVRDGDRIELQGGRPYDLDGNVLTLDAGRLTLAAVDDARRRPIVRWTLPGDRRFNDGLVRVTEGTLVVEGIDLYVDLKNQNAADSALVLFALQQSDFHLVDCSVTVLNAGRLPVTLVALAGERPWDPGALGDPPQPLKAEIRNSLIRAVETVVAVDSRQARVLVENSIVCGPGGLVHVYHTRPMEFDHHRLQLDVNQSVLDLTGPVVAIDCRPFGVRPTPLHANVTSTLMANPTALARPAQVAWNSPVETETVSTAVRWSGRENVYQQWGDGLIAKTPAGPVLTLVQGPDDWRRLELGEESGWRIVPEVRLPRIPYEQRQADDYDVARGLFIDLKQIARPLRRPPR